MSVQPSQNLKIFNSTQFDTILAAPLLIWAVPLLIWVVPLLIWATPLLIWCKVRIKLTSASTEVGVEARAELGNKANLGLK